MDIVIIAASPRASSQSHSAAFAKALAEGISRTGAASRIFCLSDRGQWQAAEEAFREGKHVLFVLPIFCCGLPGTFIEFAEHLAGCSEAGEQRKVAFVIHGGLPGRGDFESCARYARTLPVMLGSEFSGIIGFVDTIGIGYMESLKNEMLQKLRNMGEEYARNAGSFSPPVDFWGPEDMGEAESRAYCRFINRFSRHVALAQGCEVGLDYRPYSETD